MRLGKYKIGTMLLGVYLLLTIGFLQDRSYLLFRLSVITYIAIHIGFWIYANRILSRYHRLARQRITEIEKERPVNVNNVLEKGILLAKPLNTKDPSFQSLKSALSMQGGHGLLWNLAGIILTDMTKYAQAIQAFDRAGQTSFDKGLVKKIEMKKKLAKRKI